MSAKRNTLLDVARLSLRLASRYMQPYSHLKSPKKFTQAQLMTCLILRAYLKTTYRGVIDVLDASAELQKLLDLKRLPHYSTLKYFADRSDTLAIVDAMLAEIVQAVAGENEAVAIYSTGVETTSASAYFRTRSGSQRKKYVKLSVCVLCGSMTPAALAVSWGPCNDKAVARELLDKSKAAVQPRTLFADAGYDAPMGSSVLSRRMGSHQLDSASRASPRRANQRKTPVEDDSTSIETKRLRSTLDRRILHERTEADHWIDARRAPSSQSVRRGRTSSPGLRHPALRTTTKDLFVFNRAKLF